MQRQLLSHFKTFLNIYHKFCDGEPSKKFIAIGKNTKNIKYQNDLRIQLNVYFTKYINRILLSRLFLGVCVNIWQYKIVIFHVVYVNELNGLDKRRNQDVKMKLVLNLVIIIVIFFARSKYFCCMKRNNANKLLCWLV